MQGLAIRIAKRLDPALCRRGAVWADRSHARIPRTPLEVRRALAYVLDDGRHHGPTRRSLSYAFHFDGSRHPPPPMPVHDPPCRPPGTWLVSRGWRRHGRLDVDGGAAETASDRPPRRATICVGLVQLVGSGSVSPDVPPPSRRESSTSRWSRADAAYTLAW